MDWAKAKTILIVALLVTNIFLVATYGTMGVKNEPQALDEGALIEILEQRGIFLETKIPKQPKSMDVLAVNVVRSDEGEVEALLASEGASELFNLSHLISSEEWLDLDNIEIANAYVEAAVNFITALGFMDESVRFQELSITGGNSVLVEFENLYEGIPLEESTMVCRFREGRLVGLDTLWLKPIEKHRKKVSITNPAVALLALVGEKKSEEQWIVNKIELMYWLNTNDSNIEATVSDTVFPAWCITYNQGEKMYFAASQL